MVRLCSLKYLYIHPDLVLPVIDEPLKKSCFPRSYVPLHHDGERPFHVTLLTRLTTTTRTGTQTSRGRHFDQSETFCRLAEILGQAIMTKFMIHLKKSHNRLSRVLVNFVALSRAAQTVMHVSNNKLKQELKPRVT